MSHMKRLMCAACAALLVLPLPIEAQTPAPTAEQYYVAALERMRHTAQPRSLRYHAAIDVQNGGVTLVRKGDGTLEAHIGNPPGGKPHAEATIAIVPVGTRYTATLQNGDVAASQRPFLNASWDGIDEWIRYGVGGPPENAIAPTLPSPEATNEPHVIAVVTSFGLANYRVRDIGPATCANGDPAHAVQLIARGDGLAHPLNYAAIDERTQLFCTLRFNAPIQTDPGVSAHASVELHLAQIGGYYLISDELVEATGRFFGFQVARVVSAVRFSEFTF